MTLLFNVYSSCPYTSTKYGQESGNVSRWLLLFYKMLFQEMEKFVLGCLVVADNDNIKTIAFPSLGTGSLGFQGQVTARYKTDSNITHYVGDSDWSRAMVKPSITSWPGGR